jgi:Pyridoxamine 5'-phosphate oxidase
LTGSDPRRVRPRFPPEWEVPEDPKLWITWSHASQKLAREEVYWVSTSGKKGKPHAAPVWGIWKGNRFFFETPPWSVKGRNLRTTKGVVVHVQDGLDTVIVEGTASRLRQKRELEKLKKDYISKYDYTPDWSDDLKQVVFAVRPSVVHAWRVPKMHRTLVNFLF